MREHDQNHRLGNEVGLGESIQDTVKSARTPHGGAFNRNSVAESDDARLDGSDVAGGLLLSKRRGGESIREQVQP
ncbi:MAG: hypothetical protein M3434_12545 [Gemmatimonadota bacterium]|jgi:hypothetical protein|nr:hypothetical protein [Gemmatimonadota bacterium]